MLSYTLTPFTGAKRNEGRHTVVATVEVRRHTILVSAFSLVAGILLCLPVMLFIGAWALIVPLLAVLAGNWLFVNRQRRGLNVYRYKTLFDSHKQARGFFINGHPFETPKIIMHTATMVTVPEPMSPDRGRTHR